MTKSPTMNRVAGIFNVVVLTVMIALVISLGASILHALLRFVLRWTGTAMSQFWISLIIIETLGTYYILNARGEYDEPLEKLLPMEGSNRLAINLKIFFANSWRRMVASLFFMALIAIAAIILQGIIEESSYCKRLPFWIPLFISWLFFTYTEVLREYQKEHGEDTN